MQHGSHVRNLQPHECALVEERADTAAFIELALRKTEQGIGDRNGDHFHVGILRSHLREATAINLLQLPCLAFLALTSPY